MRAAQRHLLGRVAADHRVLHVEQHVEDVGAQRPGGRCTPCLARFGATWPFGIARSTNSAGTCSSRSMLALQEAQPARLLLFDDADLDPVDHRQAPALEARQQGLALGIVGGRLGVVEALAVGRGCAPARSASCAATARAGTARCRPGGPGCRRHRPRPPRAPPRRTGRRWPAVCRKRGRGVFEPEPQRVAVQRLQAVDRAVVVEGLALAQRAAGAARPGRPAPCCSSPVQTGLFSAGSAKRLKL